MRTKIVSAFPGVGKSYYHNNHKEVTLDCESSNFSWIKDENGNNTNERNPEFPQNYINYIKENIGKYEIIFVSSHKEVLEALFDNCLYFYLVYPDIYRKDEFLKRYEERGNDNLFIKLLSDNWKKWIDEIEWLKWKNDPGCCLLKAYDEWYMNEVLEYLERKNISWKNLL